MSTLQTFRFWLEPDKDIPEFKRLRWQVVGVSIADVLLQGVHPWMGPDKCWSLPDEFVKHLNQEEVKVPALIRFSLSHDLLDGYGTHYGTRCRFTRMLEVIQQDIYFVEELSYLHLLEIAKARIRGRWCHDVALDLAKQAFGLFQDLRQFLKSKDRKIKLSSFEDLDRYDLSQVLCVEDFADRDALLIRQGIPNQNFRSVRFL